MRVSALPLAVIAAAAVGLALAGCGGEPRRAAVRELTTPTVAQPAETARVTDPDRARYVREVDGVCAKRNPQRDEAVGEAERAPDVEHAVQAYDTSIAYAEQQLRDIETLAPPSGDKALIERNVVDRLRDRLALRRELRTDLLESDVTSAAQHRAQLDALTIALQAFARGYGFRVCGAR